MEIDIILDTQIPPEEITQLGLLAEQYGLGTVWNASYLNGRDPFTTLSDLARQSTSINVAPMALNAYEMHPYRIGLALLTLNEISGGKAQAMIGGGGEVVQSLGIAPEKRVRYVRECIEIVKGMCHNRPFTYEGELFSINNYNPQWVSAKPPFIYAGANRPQMLNMAAKVADGIMMSDLSPNLVKGAIETVHEKMDEIGRDKTDFRFNNFMAWYVYDDPEEARHEARRWIGYRAIFREYMMREFLSKEEFEMILAHIPAIYAMAEKNESSVEGLPDYLLDACVDNLTLTGGVNKLDHIVEHLLEFKAVGMTHVSIALKSHHAKSIKLIGERVLPALRRF